MSVLKRVKSAVGPAIGSLPSRIRQHRRLRVLKARGVIQSRECLAADLGRLPLRPGAIVLVHSSLKSLGFVEGGAATAVKALLEAIVERRGGTVLLPTFSIDGSMHRTLASGRLFDVERTACNLGAIPEAFRRHPDARRSLHPTHSFTAIGPAADALTEGHHLARSSFGKGTPMARLLEADGYLLGLGTDLGRVTFYHCLEEIEASFPLDVFTPDSPIDVMCRDSNGECHKLSVHAHDPSVARRRIDHPANHDLRAFFQDRFERHAGLTWHRVGEASSWLIEAQKLYAEIERLMTAGITIYSSPAELDAYPKRAGENGGSGPA